MIRGGAISLHSSPLRNGKFLNAPDKKIGCLRNRSLFALLAQRLLSQTSCLAVPVSPIWSIKKFFVPSKSLCREIAPSAVHRNNDVYRQPLHCKMQNCRSQQKDSISYWRHAEKIWQFLVFCNIPAADEQGGSAERSLRQDAE